MELKVQFFATEKAFKQENDVYNVIGKSSYYMHDHVFKTFLEFEPFAMDLLNDVYELQAYEITFNKEMVYASKDQPLDLHTFKTFKTLFHIATIMKIAFDRDLAENLIIDLGN